MENQSSEKSVVYDYKTVRVKRDMEAMLVDSYEALGYEITNTSLAEGSLNCVNVSMKRNRKINNKINLIKCQEKVDNILNNIEKLQRGKRDAGMAEGITTGAVGTLIFGGGMSMCLCLNGLGYLIGGIALGMAGVGVGLLGWLIHSKVKKRKLTVIEPALESELNKLSDILEEANNLTK